MVSYTTRHVYYAMPRCRSVSCLSDSVCRDQIRLLGFTTLHDSRRYTIPRCLGPLSYLIYLISISFLYVFFSSQSFAARERRLRQSRLRRDGTATTGRLPLALCTSARPHRAGALAHLHTRATSSRRAREHRAAAAPAAARLLQVLQRARAGAQLHHDAAALSAAASGATPRAPRALSRLRAHCCLCYGRQA